MIKVKSIDHVAIAVPSLDDARSNLAALFGLLATPVERVEGQKTDVVFLRPEEGPAAIELICPNGNASLERFLTARGQALHHVCFEVEDLAAALLALKDAGVPLVDEAPRTGARGHLVAFLHPRATGGVLFELCQKAPSEGENR
jgi:methylmalonyl-CoA epimerase